MKSLIIYFSHTGENYMEDGIRNIIKGNTEKAAEIIKNITGGDMFGIVPTKPYPYNYKECCDKALEEINSNARPAVQSIPKNIDEYDVIYVGGPVWYGHYPCALLNALEQLNFKGKRLKFFTTHEGSDLGSTPEDVKTCCESADIQKGLALRGSDAENLGKIIESWCNE